MTEPRISLEEIHGRITGHSDAVKGFRLRNELGRAGGGIFLQSEIQSGEIHAHEVEAIVNAVQIRRAMLGVMPGLEARGEEKIELDMRVGAAAV